MAAPFTTFYKRLVFRSLYFMSSPMHGGRKYSIIHLMKQSQRTRNTFTYFRDYERKRPRVSDTQKRLCLLSLSAVVLAKAKDSDNEEEEVIFRLKKAKLAEMKGEFEDAEKMYHQALDLLKDYEERKVWDADKLTQSRAHIYDSMGTLALSMGNLDGAESLFKETMKGLLEQGYGEDHDSMMEISLKLAMIFALRDEHEKADIGYKHIVEKQTQKVKKQEYSDMNSVALLGMFANSYSRYLMERQRLNEARAQMETALDAAKRSLGEDHPQIPVLYSDMGNIASMENKMDEALGHMTTALKLGRKIDSPDVSVFLCNLGNVYLRRGETDLARKHCAEAQKLANKVGDEESAKMAKVCLDSVKEKLKKK